MDVVLEMQNISKRFTGVQALKDVNLKLYTHEIHSLIGQNGAGKSTLMKVLSGNYRHDEGKILIDGQEVSITSTADAAKLGIGIVYQELSLLNNLTVVENIFLGRELMKGAALNTHEMREQAKASLRDLGIENINVDQKVEVFSLAQKQLIEIAKALSMKPRILILDEPTAALTNEDTERLFRILFTLRDQGIALVFISHRLGEIKKYCDRGTILMNGQVTANVLMDEVDERQIIEYMLGDSYNGFKRHSGAAVLREEPIVELRDICLKNQLEHVSCKIYPGEITGFTGLLGAGQDILWRVVYGDIKPDSGEILVRGKPVAISSPKQAVQAGIGLLTENRKEEGLFQEMSVQDNIALPSLKRFRVARFLPYLNVRRMRNEGLKYANSLSIKMRNVHTAIRFLSGGNQQKAIVSRWLMRNLDVLVFIEPTRGVDVGAKTEIYRILEQLAQEGKAIVVISTDSTEVLELSGKINVMRQGRITHVLSEPPEEETLLRMIQGKDGDD